MAGVKKRVDIFINGQQATKTIGELKKESKKLKNEINQLAPGTQEYIDKTKQLQGVNTKLKKHGQAVRGIGSSFKSVGQQMGGYVKNMIGPAGIIALGALAVKGVTQWVQKNKELEKALSSLQSITGASKEDLKAYKEEAIEIGRTTTLSAKQAVDGFKLIGSAKPELLSNKDALVEVTKQAVTLAEAAELELGPASQSLAGTLNQFNLEADQSGRVINVLAAGSKAGAADILSLNDSLDKTGTVANANNISLEENVALLETLAEKNIKGAEAGTKLRNVLTTMSTIEALPPAALAQLEEFGVNTELVSDKTVPFQERLKELAKIQDDSTALVKVFGKENLVTGQILLQNADKVQAYTDAVTGTNVANEQAAINTDNLDGDLKSLGSAWEGLLLTIGGSNSIIRPVIQVFTEALNIFSDLTSAFKEGDQLKAETTFLKIGKALTYINPAMFLFGDSFRDAIDEQIRFKELTSDVIDEIKDQAREVDVLTSALGQNNEMLKKGNLTAEETAIINEQNNEIINRLKEDYPKLTEEMDLQSASLEELSVFQQQVTDNLVNQAIETAKAAEQEKILNEIVQQSIALNEQRAVESNRSDVTNFFADVFTDDADDIQESIDKEIEKLNELDQTFSDVESTIGELDINYGADFDVNTQIIINAKEQLAQLQNQLANTDSEADKLAINAQIEAGTKLLQNSGAIREDMLNDILGNKVESETAAEETVTETTEAEIAKRTKARKNAAKKQKRDLDKLIDELQKIKDKATDLRTEFENEKRISLLESDEAKELAELEITLDKKFKKEIEEAEKLSAVKGDIGVQAQEQLNALELLKAEELEYQKGIIVEKYRLEDEEKLKAKLERESELEISAQESLLDLKVLKATQAFEKTGNFEFKVRQELREKLNQALIEQIEFEQEQETNALYEKFENEEITGEEYRARKLELDIEYNARVEEVESEAHEKRKARNAETITNALENTQKVIQIIGQFREAQLNSDIKRYNKDAKSRHEALEAEYEQGLISKEEYEAGKRSIENDTQEKINAKKTEAAKKQKTADIVQAGINTAVGFTKALASAPPPANFVNAGLVAAAGAGQIAIIASKEIPQFKDGGYNGKHKVKGAQDGKTYDASFVGNHSGGMLPSSPSLILASEEGPEYYVPNPLLSDPRVAQHISIIEAIRTNQMVDGGFTGDNATLTPTDIQGSQGVSQINEKDQLMIDLLISLNEKLPNIKAVIGDEQVDDITEKQLEISEIRGE